MYTYKIFDDGYDIIQNSRTVITQRDPYGKVFDPNGSYEDNARMHVEQLNNPAPHDPTEEEKLRADVDYLALMTDVELPSQGGES